MASWDDKELFDIPLNHWQAWIPVLPVMMLAGAAIGGLLRWMT